MKANTSASLYVLTALFLVLSVVFLSNRDSVSKLADSVGGQMAAISGSGSGLIGHWTFDDATGNDSAGSNDANVSGPSAVSGKVGGALRFDGTDDYVGFGTVSEVNESDALTVSAWVKSNQRTSNMYIVAKETSSTESWSLYWSQGSGGFYGFNVFAGNGGNFARTPLGVVPNGSWQHVVGVYGEGKIKLYYNGNLQGPPLNAGTQPSLSGSIKNTSLGVCVGTWSAGGGSCIPGSGSWQGDIDDVRIYNRALSAAEVGELFALGGGTVTPEPPVVIDPPVVVVPGTPTVSITSPSNRGTMTSSPVSITATAAASGANTIAGVQFKVDGENLGSEDTSSPYSRSWTTTGLSGWHTIAAVARDSSGQTSTASINVSVNIGGGTIPPSTVTPAPLRTVSWTSPVGIPEPPFGIREDVTHLILRGNETCQKNPEKCYDYGNGSEPYRLNANGEPYTHYVDNTHPDAILNNFDPSPFGSPSAPLKRLPQIIPPGSIVEVHGNYTESHTSYNARFAGTADRPAYIRSSICNQQNICNLADRAKVTGSWDITGSYGIVENLFFTDADGDYSGGETGMLGVSAPSDHISIRHNELRGNLKNGQMGAAGYSYAPSTPMNSGVNVSNPAAIPENVVMLTNNEYGVFYKNTVHHGGNTFAPTDSPSDGADRGGIFLTGRHMWALDNTCYSNGSTCIRTGGYVPNQAHISLAAIQYIYIGRNKAWDNREANYWTKQAHHVVFSENISGAAYQAQGADGKAGGMGFQYGPEDVWFINNTLYDTRTGISTGSDDNYIHQNAYFIGNVLYNIHKGDGDRGTPQAAISLGSGVDNYIVNNTIHNVDAGIYVLNSRNNYISGNIISNVKNVTDNFFGHIVLQDNVLGSTPRLTNNIFYQPGGTIKVSFPESHGHSNPNSIGVSSGNIEGDPQFVNASTQNFQILSGSIARDAGNDQLLELLAARYEGIYGVNIRKDILGNSRSQGAGLDIGAYEYCEGGNCSQPPIETTHTLSVMKSGTGQGTVRSTLGSINCGTICDYNGSSVTTVTLTATPADESVFSGWSGACSGTGACSVTLNSNKAVTAIFTFTCNGCDDVDETKPVVSDISTTKLAPKAATISWATNEPATSQVEYGTTLSYGNLSAASDAKVLNHEVGISGLTPNTLYHYRVISRDASGNTQMSADRTFTTPKYGQGTRVVTTKVISAKGYNYSRDGITTPILPIGTMGTVVSDEKTTLSRSSSGWLVVFDKDSQDECNPTWADESDQICEGIIDWMRYFSEVLDWSGTAPVVQESYFTEYVAPIITPPVIINAGGTGVVSPGGRTNTGSSGGSSGGRSSVAPTPAAPSPVPAPAAISPAKPLAVGTAATTYSAVQAQAITKQLLKGSTGSEVLALQAALAKENLLKGTYIKGTFDNATEVALKSFQQKYFIVISGTPSTTGFGATGPKTRTKLNLILAKLPVTTQTISAPKASSSAVPATSAKPQITKQLSLGVKDAEVSILQAILVKEKLLTTYTKGVFDAATETALKAFQKKYGIVSSGTVSTTGYGSTGPKTRAKLNQI